MEELLSVGDDSTPKAFARASVFRSAVEFSLLFTCGVVVEDLAEVLFGWAPSRRGPYFTAGALAILHVVYKRYRAHRTRMNSTYL
jgi:hypothetical protein